MHVLLHFLLLVTGGTLSVATSVSSNELKEMQQVNATVLWEQRYESVQKQGLYHHDSLRDGFQTASMQVARVYKDMLKTISGVQQACTEKADCRDADKACCWVPGSNYK